jgi:lysophospholipase L1-like esterase
MARVSARPPVSALLRRGCLTLLLLAALGEIGVRAVDAFRGGTGSLYDAIVPGAPGQRFRLRPGTAVTQPERYGDIAYRLNRGGYRDGEPRPDAHRIVLLGDSVSFGLGVDQDKIYPALLEKRLGGSWDVVNLAIFAYNTADERQALQEDGLKLRPELVLLEFYMNDFTIAAAGGSRPDPPGLMDRLAGLRNLVLSRSALYRRLHQGGTALTFHLFHGVRRRRFPERLNADEPRQKSAYLQSLPDDGGVAAFREIREIDRLARSHGARLLVVLSPDEVQLFTRRYDGINERFRAFCQRAGIDLFDPLPALRAEPDPVRLYNDGVHYSAEGHAALARLLYTELVRRGLVSGGPPP